MSLPQEKTKNNQAEPILPSSGRLALVTRCTRKDTRATTRATFTGAKTNLLWALITRTITKGK